MPAPDYALEIGGLRDALASGELTIETNGERVTYQSFAQIKARLDYFEGLASASGVDAPASQFGFSAVGFSRD